MENETEEEDSVPHHHEIQMEPTHSHQENEETLIEEKIVFFDERFIDEWFKPPKEDNNTEQLQKQIEHLQTLLAQLATRQ